MFFSEDDYQFESIERLVLSDELKVNKRPEIH
jgi:hypothetical protein